MLPLDQVVPLILAEVTFPIGHPQAGTQGPVYAFAVLCPDGVVLVDSGVGTGSAGVDIAYQPRRIAVPDALAP